MTERKKPMRWARKKHERFHLVGPKGSDLRQGGKSLGYTSFTLDKQRWYWCGQYNAQNYNSLWDDVSYSTEDEAKADLLAYAKNGTKPTKK